MVEKKAGLTPLQVEVLEWIKAGQPSGVFGEGDDLTYRGHARWLEKYGLVSISGSGDTWKVKLTSLGRKWPETPARLRPAPVSRSRRTTPKRGPSSPAPAREEAPSPSNGASKPTKDASGSMGSFPAYRLQVTRVQIAERRIEARSEKEAIRKIQKELEKPFGFVGTWKIAHTEIEVVEVEQPPTERINMSPSHKPLLLSFEDAATELGLPLEIFEELVLKGDIECIEISSSKYVPREVLQDFVKGRAQKTRQDEPRQSAPQNIFLVPSEATDPGDFSRSRSTTTPASSSLESQSSSVRGSGKPPVHPGQILMTHFIGSRQSLHEVAAGAEMSMKRLQQIVNGKRDIGPSDAGSLDMYFGNGAAFWSNLQRRYDRLKS